MYRNAYLKFECPLGKMDMCVRRLLRNNFICWFNIKGMLNEMRDFLIFLVSLLDFFLLWEDHLVAMPLRVLRLSYDSYIITLHSRNSTLSLL